MRSAADISKHAWRFFTGCFTHWRDMGRLLEDPDFARRCWAERDNLKSYFACGLDLSRLAFDLGTILFEEERRLLQQLVELSNALPGPIVEIGTLFGETTPRLAVWKAPGKKIVTVDNYSWNPWGLSPPTHELFTRRFLHYLTETVQVEVVKSDKDAFYRKYRGERPSLVFLDADHTYEATKADIQWAQRIGARIICGHDYSDANPGVGRAVCEMGGAARRACTLWALNSVFLPTAQSPAA